MMLWCKISFHACLVIVWVRIRPTFSRTAAAADEQSCEGKTDGEEQPQDDGGEEADVLQQEILPVILRQIYAFFRSSVDGSDDHTRIYRGGQDVVSEDEIKEGVCEPVHLLHAHAGAA